VAVDETSRSLVSPAANGASTRFGAFAMRADKVFFGAHALVWCLVMVVWIVAWQRVRGPIHPEFNTSKRFLGTVDILVYLNVDALSFRIATLTPGLRSLDVGLTYVLLLSSLMLLAGSVQWFLIGRLVQWTCSRYGTRLAKYLTAAIAIWVGFAAFSWWAWWWL
jgi:hypothetical protein